MAQESWTAYGGKLVLTIGGKMVLNAFVPGSGSAIEFYQAAKCFYGGDVSGGVINFITGAVDLATLGLAGATKDAMKESAKGAAVQTAKYTAKTAAKKASRKVGQDLAKHLAMGTIEGGKEAAINTAKAVAKSASKQATRKAGQQVGKEIAKGVVTEVVEEAWHEGTKMTFNKFLQSAGLAAISSGGRQVLKTTLEDVGEKLIVETLKQKPKYIAFELTKIAAKKGAEEEFKKHFYKVIVKDAGVSGLKGLVNYLDQGEDSL